MTRFKVGDRVRLKVAAEPYYSGYAGNPKVAFLPGTEGTIREVGVPFVRESPRSLASKGVFNCVDFLVDGREWRVSATDGELAAVPKG